MEQNNNWRYNIPIGSHIRIDDNYEEYVFYGYNHNRTIASCFPINSSCVNENIIFIPILAILSIIAKSNIENEIKNLKI
jgi:hypothetical protein